MTWSARRVDRIAARMIYIGLGIAVIWAGSALTNYTLETKFYKDFLLGWKVAAQRYQAKGIPWPVFNGRNHMEYMSELVRTMKASGIYPPCSNTKEPYTYVLDRLWKKEERIFVLLLREKMVIYGMSPKTFEKIDRYIDGSVNLRSGKFRGKVSKTGYTVIGIWG